MRLFIAIRFSKKTADAVGDVMSKLRKQGMTGNFTDPRNLHMTLVFIGETERAPEIIDAMNAVRVPRMKVSFDRVGHFGDLYWIGSGKDPVLSSYVRSLRGELDRRGIRYDRRAFRPHVTLVRRARIAGTPESRTDHGRDSGWHAPEIKIPGMYVAAVSLMRSDRVDGKIRYTEIARVEAR
jgi:2'-5' RNA ligase